jgi:uncharacterized protein (DUF3084 family)
MPAIKDLEIDFKASASALDEQTATVNDDIANLIATKYQILDQEQAFMDQTVKLAEDRRDFEIWKEKETKSICAEYHTNLSKLIEREKHLDIRAAEVSSCDLKAKADILKCTLRSKLHKDLDMRLADLTKRGDVPEVKTKLYEGKEAKRLAAIIELKELEDKVTGQIATFESTACEVDQALDSKAQELIIVSQGAASQVTELGAKCAELDAKSAGLDAKSAELNLKATELDVKSAELDMKTQEIDAKSQEFDLKSLEIDTKSEELDAKSAALNMKAQDMHARDADLVNAIQKHNARVEAWRKQKADQEAIFSRRQDQLLLNEETMSGKSAELNEYERVLDSREMELGAREAEAEKKAKRCEQEKSKVQAELQQRETRVDSREAELDIREDELEQREDETDGREATVEHNEAQLSEHECNTSYREEDVHTREQQLSERENELDDRETTIRYKEAQLSQRESDFRYREEGVNIREQMLADHERVFNPRETNDRREGWTSNHGAW